MATNAIISDKQLGDVTLLEPMARLLANQSGVACAMYVKNAFRPLIDLMPHAVWGPEQSKVFKTSWTTSAGSRAVRATLPLNVDQKILITENLDRVRWWYRFVFDQIKTDSIRYEYWAQYFWRAVGGDISAFSGPKLNLPPDEWRHPELAKDRPYMLINPTAATTDKFWPTDYWRELLSAKMSSRDITWVMTGGASLDEMVHCKAIAAAMNSRLIDLSGRTSLRQYLHTLSRAEMLISIDGSASHIAQAFGVPAVTLFGPSYHTLWHLSTPNHVAVYPGRGLDYSSSPITMKDLHPDKVGEVLERQLHRLKQSS